MPDRGSVQRTPAYIEEGGTDSESDSGMAGDEESRVAVKSEHDADEDFERAQLSTGLSEPVDGASPVQANDGSESAAGCLVDGGDRVDCVGLTVAPYEESGDGVGHLDATAPYEEFQLQLETCVCAELTAADDAMVLFNDAGRETVALYATLPGHLPLDRRCELLGRIRALNAYMRFVPRFISVSSSARLLIGLLGRCHRLPQRSILQVCRSSHCTLRP